MKNPHGTNPACPHCASRFLELAALKKELEAMKYAYQLDEELIGMIQKIISKLANRPSILLP